MFSAATHPYASVSGNCSGRRGSIRERIRSRASSRGIRPFAESWSCACRSAMPRSLLRPSEGAMRPLGGGSDELRALHVLGEPRAELGAEVVALGAELDGRLQVVERVAHVEASALEPVRVDRLLLGQQVDRVRDLDLAT